MDGFNKAESRTVKRIQSVASKLETELGLSAFLDIVHIFDPGSGSDSSAPSYAETTPNWHYRSGCIRWYLQPICSITDEELEKTAIHEYAHILIHPITQLITSDEASTREEYVTESISRAICHARGMKHVH